MKKFAEQAFKFYERRHAVRFLTRQGFKILGRGAFATVLGHPDHPNRVIKVASYTSRRIRHFRDGFSTYVDWLQQTRTRSKFAPRIYYFRDDGCLSVTVMERLYKIEDRKTRRRVNRTSEALTGRKVDDTLPAIRRYVERFRTLGRLDLHAGNVMRRLNGDLVVTDPLVHYT